MILLNVRLKLPDTMPKKVLLPDELLERAQRCGSATNRSVSQQIEVWARIGLIAEENPDLSYAYINDILLSQAEEESGELTEYTFGPTYSKKH